MKRAPYYDKPPTPDEVRVAWAKARPGGELYQRRFGFAQRAFLQGVVGEHLRQEAVRAERPKAYRAPSTSVRRAIELTRAWLEFGDCHDDDRSET